MRFRAYALLLALAGCGGASEESSPPVEEPEKCAPEEQLIAGECLRPGVPPEACAAPGFEPDGASGCRAILPAEPCPKGTMATPGATACSEVAPCGTGKWGAIPVEPTTEYVDIAYAGSDSDGTAQKPWRTIQDAVDAAAPGAIVAVAEGRYVGDVMMIGKPVRLWGKCPSLVEISGSGTSLCAVGMIEGSHNAEVHDIAVTGTRCGVGASGSEGVVVERVWIHDTGTEGIVQDGTLGPSQMTIRGTLVESARKSSVYLRGSPQVIEGSVIRDSLAGSDGTYGRCIVAQNDFTETQARANLSVHGSLLERCSELGIMAGGSDLTVEATLVRYTLPQQTTMQFGRGINLQDLGGQPSNVTLRAIVVDDSHDVGIFVGGSEALIEAVTVRNTKAEAALTSIAGGGVIAQKDPTTLMRSRMTLRASLVDTQMGMGIAITGADGVIEDVLVRGTTATAENVYGDGIVVLHFDVNPTTATVSRSRIDASARAGISSFGARVELSASMVECAAFALSADARDGLPAEFLDLGDNACGCAGTPQTCVAASANLQPPTPVAGAP
jgi:hypothetical protein